jgi:hypothetical protein
VAALCHVLDVFGHGDPGVNSIFVDRERGCREARVREGSDGDRDAFRHAFNHIVDRGPAGGAKSEPGLAAVVTGTDVFHTTAGNFNGRSCEPGLSRGDASRSSLTGITMTHRHAVRLTRNVRRELAAAARGDSRCDDEAFTLWQPVFSFSSSGRAAMAA